jgi:hypothetical protein
MAVEKGVKKAAPAPKVEDDMEEEEDSTFNCEMSVDAKKILTIKIDLKQLGELSKSGKSRCIATTRGNIPVPGYAKAKIGLNVYVPVRG